MKMLAVMTVLLSAFVLHSEVFAQEARVSQGQALEEGSYTHDGFFLRFCTGLGSGTFTGERMGERGQQRFQGALGSFELAVGGAVREDLIVHATIISAGLPQPDFQTHGDGFPDEGSDVTVGFLGVGVTYYLSNNIYLSGSLGGNNIIFHEPGKESTLKLQGDSVSATVQVGKEWWVSENVGMGVAAQAQAGGLIYEQEGKESDWGYFNYGLLLSLTYN